MLMTGCSEETAPFAVLEEAPEGPQMMALSKKGVPHQAPLGGLDLNGYCRSIGFAFSVATKGRFGPNAAFNNWRCSNADRSVLRPFSMVQACKWQYDLKAVQAHPLNRNDAFSWRCWGTPANR